MNEMAYRCEWIVGQGGGLAHLDLDALQHHLQRTPNGARGYADPVELARDWAMRTAD
ncbi:hypothetical protein [Sporichthya sp.]|uniref:hypothetical protein n=1 Tax=Sporichthya sp. TaxID=65475 RepID=UPI0017A7255A|nr:hypothetical protein [Sporichthya sp.]MBA3741453.1 hypothetical protein [Sporichthya sp.]